MESVRFGKLPFGIGLPLFQLSAESAIQKQRFDIVAGFGVQAPAQSVIWVQSVHAAWWGKCQQTRHGLARARQLINPFHRIVLGLERRMFEGRRYRRLIALTAEVKRDLQRFYGVPESDVEILPNGFNKAEFNIGLRSLFRSSLRSRFAIPESAWTVLFVANEWERKGLIPLMKALGESREKDIHLIVAGCLPETMLWREAKYYGIDRRVHFVGSRESVNQWFGAADAFVLPTSYEAWGMVIVEALASGLPVLTSRAAGAAITISDGLNGFLLEHPHDSAEILFGLNRLRNGVAWDASQIATSVASYEWSALFHRYEEVLRRSL